jgi:hypothetical protein
VLLSFIEVSFSSIKLSHLAFAGLGSSNLGCVNGLGLKKPINYMLFNFVVYVSIFNFL